MEKSEIFTWIAALLTASVAAANVLEGSYAFASFAFLASVTMVLPAIIGRSLEDVAAPEAALLAGAPFAAELFIPLIEPRYLSYFAASGIALIAASELEEFTSAKFSHWLAVTFVASVTISSAGFWALVRYGSDVFLGTSILNSHTALMWEFTLASGSGLAAGGFFDAYFERWRYGES